MLSTSQEHSCKVSQRMPFRIHKWIPNYLVVLPLLETSPSQVFPAPGIVTSHQGLITSLTEPPPFPYRHCSPCDFGRDGTASGTSHLSQTSHRMGCQNLAGGKKTQVFLRSAQYQMPSVFLMGNTELEARRRWRGVIYTTLHSPRLPLKSAHSDKLPSGKSGLDTLPLVPPKGEV